jgi:methyl-accepting chemotaxis protein
MEVKMNNFKKCSIAALSISLLLSAPAHAGFAELYQQAGKYAQNLWANRPSMPAVSLPSVSMPKISMPELTMPAISLPAISMPKISMPSVSRAQMEAGFEAVGKYAQKAEAVLANYPKTVAATKMAAKVVPVVLAGGYLAKKAVNAYKYAQEEQESWMYQMMLKSRVGRPEEIRQIQREMIAKLDKDLIGGGMITAVKVLQDTQAYIKDVTDRKEEKIPGALHFERDLGRYIDIFPNFLGDLNKEWNTFVRLAIAHDNAKDNRFAEDLLASFDRVIAQLHELNALFLHEDVEQINNSLEQVNNAVEPNQAEAEHNNEQLVKRVIGG